MGCLFSFLAVASLLISLGAFSFGMSGSSGAYFLSLFAFAFFIFSVMTAKNEKAKKEKNKSKEEEELRKIGFAKDKEVLIPATAQRIAFDEDNERFAIFKKTNEFDIYNFSELLEFELVEDGRTITKGKTMQTVAGGLTFGIVGAIVGASGKKKKKKEVNQMYINLEMNSLKNSRIKLPLLKYKVKTNSGSYRMATEAAKEIVSALKYIQNKQKGKEAEQTN